MIPSDNPTIGIRAIELSDLPTIQKWRNSPSFRRYFREYRELSLSQIQDWYKLLNTDSTREMFMIVENTSLLLGVAGLTSIDFVNRHADIHFYIGNDLAWVDTFYAPATFPILLNYGFNTLNLQKLWAEVYEIDTKKIDFFTAQGFSLDARLRNHYFYEGKYYDSLIFSLLKSDFTS